MKTILMLHDEAGWPKLLQDNKPVKAPLPQIGAVAGCTCDRWGHPCTGCHQQNVQIKEELTDYREF